MGPITNISPPIDVYEELIIVDPVDNTVGFVAEGVLEHEGSWNKAGDTREGDSLWAWIPTGSRITVETIKKQGWLVRGHMPLFYEGIWLIMGLRPGILFYKFGIKDQSRIEIDNKSIIINGIIKIKGSEISNRNFLEDYLKKKKKNEMEAAKTAATEAAAARAAAVATAAAKAAQAKPPEVQHEVPPQLSSQTRVTGSTREKVMQVFKDRKASEPAIILKYLFPLVELSDRMFKRIASKQAFRNFIFRLSFLMDIQIKTYHFFSFIEDRLRILDGEPLDKEIAKTITPASIRSEGPSPLGEGYIILPLFNKAGLLLNVDKKLSDTDSNFLKKMFSFSDAIVSYITGSNN